ncbi:unnamed protein product [Microthlaspi erraticum]|uniref:Uncharacterized protein n=1 Tax=Microthlaspi erraticum TaxID=1685480 RepID=A0A6D2I8B6_9BRAS|nr:unnamed protein product [Microthlaspi erraticum]
MSPTQITGGGFCAINENRKTKQVSMFCAAIKKTFEQEREPSPEIGGEEEGFRAVNLRPGPAGDWSGDKLLRPDGEHFSNGTSSVSDVDARQRTEERTEQST